jgi:uncharacterized protein YsxB (DUF464 family)
MSSLPCLHLTSRAGLLIKSEKDGLSLYNYTVELPIMFLEWSYSFSTTHQPHWKPPFSRHNNKTDGGGDKAGAACSSVCAGSLNTAWILFVQVSWTRRGYCLCRFPEHGVDIVCAGFLNTMWILFVQFSWTRCAYCLCKFPEHGVDIVCADFLNTAWILFEQVSWTQCGYCLCRFPEHGVDIICAIFLNTVWILFV